MPSPLFQAYGLDDIPAPTPAPTPAPRTALGTAKDVGISAVKGIIGVPEAAVGLLDIVTGGAAGKTLEEAGFRPKEAKAMLDEEYSPAQKAANQKVQAAQGLGDTFMEAIKNPSVIAHSIVESLPSMGAGAVVARGGLAALPAVAPALAERIAVGQAAPFVASQSARSAAQNAPLVAGALGEGVVGAGSAAEQIRQETQDGTLTGAQSGLAALSGVATAGFGLLGGKIAQKLDIADVDTMLAGAARSSPEVQKSLARRVLEGAVSEGLLEELPQSISEQVIQNMALGKPLDEGLNQAAVLGLLSGAAMGGGPNLLPGRAAQPGNEQGGTAAPPAAPAAPPVALVQGNGPLSRAANSGIVAAQQGIAPSLTGATGADLLATPENPLMAAARVREEDARQQTLAEDAMAKLEAFYQADMRDLQAQRFEGQKPAQAPVNTAPVATEKIAEQEGVTGEDAAALPFPQPGDILNPAGEPFKGKGPAMRAAKKTPGEVLQVFGGWIVRPTGGANVGATAQAGAVDSGTGGQLGVDAAGSNPAGGRLPTGAAGRVRDIAPAPATGGPASGVVGNANQINGALNDQNQPTREDRKAKAKKDKAPAPAGSDAPGAAAVPAPAGPAQVEGAGVGKFDSLEDALTKERDGTTSEIESGWMDGKGRRQQTPIERAVYDAVTASVLDADAAASIVETALKEGRPDLALYAAQRAARAAESMSTTPGVSESSPKYEAIKNDLVKRKQKAQADAQTLIEKAAKGAAPATAPKTGDTITIDGKPAAKVEGGGVEPTDYLAELFGSQEQRDAAQAKYVAEQADRKAAIQRIRDEIGRQKERATTEYSDWESRRYKANKTQVDLRGDGPSNQASMSIGAINESRRRNAMDALAKELGELDKLAAAAETESGAEKILATLTTLREKAAQAVKSGNWPGATEDGMFESMLLDTLKFRGPAGKGNVTSNGLSKAMLAAIKGAATNPPAAQVEGGGVANPTKESRGPAASEAWKNEGKSAADLMAERVDALGKEFAGTLAGAVREEDFDAKEVPTGVKMWAEEQKIPADDLRAAVLKHISGFDIPTRASKQIRAALNPTNPPTQAQAGTPAEGAGESRPAPVAAPEPTAEQKIRQAFDAAPRTIGNWHKLTVEHNGKTQEFLANMKRVNTSGKRDSAIHLVNIRPGRLMAGDPLQDLAYYYKLDGKNNLVEEGIPSIATPEQLKAFGRPDPRLIPVSQRNVPKKQANLNTSAEPAQKPPESEQVEANDQTPKQEQKPDEPKRDSVVNVPPTVTKAIEDTMARQKARTMRLRREAEAAGMTLDEKKAAQTKLMAAEAGLRKMRLSVFEVEDAAIKSIEMGVVGGLIEHADLFPEVVKAVEALIGVKKPDTQSAPAISDLTRARNLLMELQAKQDANGMVGDDRLETQINQIKREIQKLEAADSQPTPAAAPAKPDPLTEQEKAAKAKMLNAAGKLATLLSKNTRLNITPEQEQQMLPIVIELFEGAMELGYVKFKQAARYVREFIAQAIDQDAADSIPIDTLQGAYIATARKYKDQGASTGKEVMQFESLADLQAADDKMLEGATEKADTGAKDVQNDPRTNAADDHQLLDEQVPGSDIEDGSGGSLEAGNGLRPTDSQGNGRPEGSWSGRGNGVDGNTQPVLPGTPAEIRPLADGPLSHDQDRPRQLAGENPGNFVITKGLNLGSGTDGQKIEGNLNAIRTLRKIQAEHRYPTRDEQAIMARYVGWGGLKTVFDPNKKDATDRYGKAQRELKQLLNTAEFRAANDSIRNAHFTEEGVVDAMWSVLRYMGFKGGRALEPTVGIGNFIGLQPADMAAGTEWHASELDTVTGQMAAMLYPEANILASTGFQDAPFADGAFDIAPGNPPFGAETITDKSPNRKHLSGMKIHNYIIAKAGMHLRPGGVIPMVVTHRFLDTANPEARDVLAKDFRFLGAFRLPNDAFKKNAGTDVVTDVVFLQKLRPDEARERDASWLDVNGTITVDGQDIRVNRYYQDHPTHILGRSAMDGTMQRGGAAEYTVHGDGRNITEAVAELISSGKFSNMENALAKTNNDKAMAPAMLQQSDLPVGGVLLGDDGKIMRRELDDSYGNAVVNEITPETLWKDQAAEWMALRDAVADIKTAFKGKGVTAEDANEVLALARFLYKTDGTQKSSPTLAEASVYQLVEDLAKPAKFVWAHDVAMVKIAETLGRKQLGEDGYRKLKGMLDLRNRTLRLVMAEQANDPQMEAYRADLNRAYDAFVKAEGFLSDSKNANLMDGDIGAEAGIEATFLPEISAAVAKSSGQPRRKAEATKSDIMRTRVNFPYKEITRAESSSDALFASLVEHGKVDLVYMAKITDKSVREVIEELTAGKNPQLFMDPETGEYQEAERYLSGNVRHKLDIAKERGIKANIQALEAALPPLKTKEQVTPSIRGIWMPENLFSEFLQTIGYRNVKVTAIASQGILSADSDSLTMSDFGIQFRHEKRTPMDMFNSAASGKPIVISYTSNGKTYRDEQGTKEVNALVDRMSKVFNEWAYSDESRVKQIVDAFNERMNTHTPRTYDGVKYLKPVGANPSVALRRTQKDASWRMMQEKVILMDHVVGAGKTYTLITGIMERRRMGLSRKPMVVVPNHLVTQWARDFYKLYPGAKVLAASPADFAKKNRRRLLARIATGDYDAVIVGHTSIGFMETPADDLTNIINEKLEGLKEALAEARKSGDSKRTLGQIQTRIAKYEERLKALAARTTDDIGIDFKALGVDYLAVDEAHEFKNLEYATSGDRVVGMNDPAGSKKAFDLYSKIRGLLARGGGVAFATGTPVSNSLVEIYTIMSYLAHDQLVLRGQEHFDSWSGAYAKTETRLEYTATQKLKPRRVLAGLNNLSALRQLYEQFADIITMSDLKRLYTEERIAANKRDGTNLRTEFPVPRVMYGGRQLSAGDITPAQQEYMDYLVARMAAIEANKSNKAYMSIDNTLNVLTDARKMSLDIRIVDPGAPRDENGKVARAAKSIKEFYDLSDADRGAQLVFCDLSTPAKTAQKDAGRIISETIAKLFDKYEAKAVKAQMNGMSFEKRWNALAAKAEELIENPDTTEEKRDAITEYMNSVEDPEATMNVADIGFSVYDDMKKVLMESGIPESEIAFIHDYNTPDQKDKLFDRVNKGYVRVLMGSSRKMGAGTNAQERLVALHHMDAPWRPSDVEQREGRIIRQQNSLYERDPDGFEVGITAYSTNNTSDTVMWQILERKAAGIEQFRKGGLDNLEEEGGDSDQYAEFMATSTGNPVFRLKLEAERRLTELEAEIGGAMIARSNARDFIGSFDRKMGNQVSYLTGANAIEVESVSYGGLSGTAAEFNEAMQRAESDYLDKFAAYQEKRSAAEIELAKWELEVELLRGDKPTLPTMPGRPTLFTKSVQKESAWARTMALALHEAKVGKSTRISLGEGVYIEIEGEVLSGGNYWKTAILSGGNRYLLETSSADQAEGSVKLAESLTPSSIETKKKNAIQSAKNQIEYLNERKKTDQERAGLSIDESKVKLAREEKKWYELQVAFAEFEADIQRGKRPNRFIARDRRRALVASSARKLGDVRTVKVNGVSYTTTGIYTQSFGGVTEQAFRDKDMLPAAVLVNNIRGDKGAILGTKTDVLEQPESIPFKPVNPSTNLRHTGAPEGNETDVVFMRGDPAPRGAKVVAVQQFMDSITEKWSNAPTVIVAANMEDPLVPKAVRDYNASQMAKDAAGAPMGFFYGGKVYVLADSLNSPQDALTVLAHEALGHYGLRGMFGDRLDGIKGQIIAMRKKEVLAKVKAYGLDPAKREDLMDAAEEVLAKMAQTVPSLGFVKRAVAIVRQWLRENIPGFGKMELTDDEIINQYIVPARGWVVRGRESGVAEPTLAFMQASAGLPLFRKGADQTTGLTPTQFTQALSEAFGAKVADRLQAKGVVVPLADQNSLPAHVVPYLRAGDVVFGFYDPRTDRTYAVLENLTPGMVKGLALHEVGVHYGFEAMLGADKYKQVMKRLDMMHAMGSKAVRAARAEAVKNAARPAQVPEETLAYLVQNSPELGLIKEVIAKIKAFLFREFGIGGKYLTEADLHMLAKAAVQHAARTEPGGVAAGRSGDNVSMSRFGGAEQRMRQALADQEAYTENPSAWFKSKLQEVADRLQPMGVDAMMSGNGQPARFWSEAVGSMVQSSELKGEARTLARLYEKINQEFDDAETGTPPKFMPVDLDPEIELMPRTDRQRVVELLQKGLRGELPTNDGAFSRTAKDQTNTPEFRNWFGDSVVTDTGKAGGKPLVVYHGTNQSFSIFDREQSREGDGVVFATPNRRVASDFAKYRTTWGGANVMPVYVKAEMVLEVHGNGRNIRDVERDTKFDGMKYGEDVRAYAARMGYDAIVFRQVRDPVSPDIDPVDDVYALLPSAQIKSAIGNNGNFDPNDPDIRFMRSSALQSAATERVADFFSKAPGTLSWWHKTIGTQYNLAQRSPKFRRVFNRAQDFLNDVSRYATEAADLAPKILPKLETWRDIGRSPISAEDNKAIAAPIFEGTLKYSRDENGDVIETDDVGTSGVVWTDAELRSRYNLTNAQIGLYREFRKATDKSLTNLAISDMLRYAGKDAAPIREAVMGALNVPDAENMLVDYLQSLADGDPERGPVLESTIAAIQKKAQRAGELMQRGYAPLSRFGQHTLDVVDASGERVYFGLFESAFEAKRMARKMLANFPGAIAHRGTVSQEEYKLFAGVSPETLELFGDLLGLESQGDSAADQAFQTYLKAAKANRSSMKRLIHRKGTAGFSEDAGRVLAGFIYSNARQTGQNLHLGELTEAAEDVNKGDTRGDGQLKDQATKLVEYIKNPVEEAQAFRGLLFAQYLGGSVASALVNMTQPVQVTFPYLSQFGGAAAAANQMKRALSDVMKSSTGDARLDAALKLAEEEGIVAPQEVHQLMAQAEGKGSLKSGDGTLAGDAAAKASNALSKLTLAWGKFFGAAEQFNRRVTFIAAYRTAVAQGIPNPAKFAEKTIAETQFVYNKGNKPNWARGAVGSTLFTFKQYSISYVELMNRMWQSGPEGKKAVLLAMGMLFLMGGAGGLPFVEDVEDLVDGAMQRLGYNFQAKQARRQFFERILGKEAAKFAETGISGLPGMPIDVSGRMGMGNLIPGTGLLVAKADHTRDATEVAGAAGDFVTRMLKGADQVLAGDITKGAATVSPTAARNAVKALEMYSTGQYKDEKGRKVLDVDGYDAMAKAIGFQPADVANVQQSDSSAQRMVAQTRLKESQIADRWAKSVVEGDQDGIQAAREMLRDWNEKNPDTPIRIAPGQIAKKVSAMRMDRAQRIEKAAPKEIRATVRRELESP